VNASTASTPISVSLRETWALRNAAADTLIRAEGHLRRQLEAASTGEIAALLESFSPARSPGPEWTRSFDPLVEHLWAWCDPELLSALEAEFRARGPAWVAVANALSPDYGERVRRQLGRHTAAGRMPTFTIG
jgi:hypothetical protein